MNYYGSDITNAVFGCINSTKSNNANKNVPPGYVFYVKQKFQFYYKNKNTISLFEY